MRKIAVAVVTLLLAFTLVACNKNELHAKVEVKGLDNEGIGPTTVNMEVKLLDPNEQIGTAVQIYLLKDSKGEPISNKSRTKEDLEEDPKVNFTSLEENTKYQVNIDVSFEGEKVSLFKQTITTRTREEFTIKTVEDFFNIKQNLYATYTLANDLDFIGQEEEINKNLLGTFRGKFEGGNFTIKNYTIKSSNSSLGLFAQLSENAQVKDLVIDNMSITKAFPNSTSGTSSYIGVLFGQNSSANVQVSNITIKNSKLDLSIDSSSNYLKFGILGGTGAGKFTNINIEDTNELSLNLKKHTEVYIGGLIGDLNASAEVKEIQNAGTIKLSINQNQDDETLPSKSGLVAKGAKVYLGGLSAKNNDSKVSDVITKTNILVKKLSYSIQGNGDDEKDKLTKDVELYVGGLYGEYKSLEAKDSIFSGNITIADKMTLTNNLTEEDGDTTKPVKLRNEYRLKLYVGGITGFTGRPETSIYNLVRSNGTINIVEQDDIHTVRYGVLFGSSTVTYKDTNTFGFNGTNNDVYNDVALELGDIRIINDVLEYFKNNPWIVANYK